MVYLKGVKQHNFDEISSNPELKEASCILFIPSDKEIEIRLAMPEKPEDGIIEESMIMAVATAKYFIENHEFVLKKFVDELLRIIYKK